MSEQKIKSITEKEVERWCDGTLSSFALQRLTDILTGEYSLDEAREDILSFRKPPKKQTI